MVSSLHETLPGKCIAVGECWISS